MATTQDIDNQEYKIKKEAHKLGLSVSAHDGIVTVAGKFTPGDRAAYVEMENNANHILSMFRQTRPGSIWGNDSGSVGGAIGLKDGSLVLHKSGCERRLSARFR
jgi:hypothetical protein